MNSDIQQIWHEILADITTPAVMWQLVIIIVALITAWMINGALRKYVQQQTSEQSKLAIGSINRVLFPLSCLFITLIGALVLSGWQHTSLLKMASRLFIAMAVIRLMVYFLRYLFSPSGWLKTLESLIAWSVWGILALHLSGILPQLAQNLEDIQFTIGKSHVNLLLVMQAMLTIVVTLFIALWLSRLLENKLMRTDHINGNLRVVLTKLIRIVLLFMAILIALSAVGLDITLLSVFGGALGVGLGFGMQRIASNYVSGFIILLDQSMQIGDLVTVDKHYGVVHEMRSRYMVLAKHDGTHVIIPNESLITTAVINHSLTERRGSVHIQLAVAYGSPLEQALQLMRFAAKQQERVLQEPIPQAYIKGFNEFGIELLLMVWVDDPENGVISLQSGLYMDIWKAFEMNKIALAKLEAKSEL